MIKIKEGFMRRGVRKSQTWRLFFLFFFPIKGLMGCREERWKAGKWKIGGEGLEGSQSKLARVAGRVCWVRHIIVMKTSARTLRHSPSSRRANLNKLLPPWAQIALVEFPPRQVSSTKCHSKSINIVWYKPPKVWGWNYLLIGRSFQVPQTSYGTKQKINRGLLLRKRNNSRNILAGIV